ncbi:hypothetical protein [Lonepinella sp. MS14437]|uniref:hypothetical protein n=1 Tax=Lonepinella TaxID=53416 RepID=UPI0036DF5390
MKKYEQFAQNLKNTLIAKGYEPKARVIRDELNRRHFGKEISWHGVARWLRGEALPEFDRLRTLGEWLEVDLSELVEPEIVQKVEQKISIKDPYFEQSAASYKDDYLFRIFTNLPSEQKKAVREVIMAMHKAYRAK